FGKRSPEDGEVLCKDIDEAAVNAAIASDKAIAGDDLLLHPEIAAAVGDELVEFLEGVFVGQAFDPLERAEFAFVVLAGTALGSADFFGRGMAAAQFFESIHSAHSSVECGSLTRRRGARRKTRRINSSGCGCELVAESVGDKLALRMGARALTQRG